MPLLIDELRCAYQEFISTGKPTASIFDDENTTHFLLCDNLYHSSDLIEFNSVIVLITLEELYQRAKIIPEDKRTVYKDFNRPYKQFVEDINEDKLESDVMLDLVFSITQPDYSSHNIAGIEIEAIGTEEIEDFITGVKKEHYIDRNDWEQELNEREFVEQEVIRQIKLVTPPFTDRTYLTANDYGISANFQAESSEHVLQRLTVLNDMVERGFNTQIKSHITRCNKQVYVDSHLIQNISSKKVFNEEFFKEISSGMSLQPVVRLSKYRHGKYYCLIPGPENNFINENNLMRLLFTGVYVPASELSVFDDEWTLLRREHTSSSLVELKQQRNHMLYDRTAEIIFCTFAQLLEDSIVKEKGIRKFLIEEGRLLAIFCTSELEDIVSGLELTEIERLMKEFKLNCFQFIESQLETIEGANHFVLGKSSDADEEISQRIWALLGKRLSL